MMNIIGNFVQHVQFLSKDLLNKNLIDTICCQQNHIWRNRNILTPHKIIILGVLQAINGNVSLKKIRG